MLRSAEIKRSLALLKDQLGVWMLGSVFIDANWSQAAADLHPKGHNNRGITTVQTRPSVQQVFGMLFVSLGCKWKSGIQGTSAVWAVVAVPASVRRRRVPLRRRPRRHGLRPREQRLAGGPADGGLVGEAPDGFLYGNPHFVGVGVYGECVRAQSPDFGLKGKFCTVVLKDNTTVAQSQREDEARPLLIQGFANTYVGFSSRYSTCIPDACTETDLMTSVSKAVDGIKEVSVMCQTLDETPQFTGADIAVISFLSIMLALMVIGTVIDVFCRFAKRSATATGKAG
nr:uncharacterized protein LOC113819590 [Penaeus vannamei]